MGFLCSDAIRANVESRSAWLSAFYYVVRVEFAYLDHLEEKCGHFDVVFGDVGSNDRR